MSGSVPRPIQLGTWERSWKWRDKRINSSATADIPHDDSSASFAHHSNPTTSASFTRVAF